MRRFILLLALILVVIAGGLSAAYRFRLALYHGLLYGVVAQRAAGGSANQEQVIIRLAEFVFNNMHAPQSPATDYSPADTLVQGWAYCDGQVFVFMRLAAQMGLDTRMMFLRETSGTSPHTVAEVDVGGRWALVDVFYGYVAKRTDGSLATVDDAVAQSDPLFALTDTPPEWYQHATVFASMSPDRRSSTVVRRIPGWLANWLQDLYLMTPPPSLALPRELGGQDGYATPAGRLYYRARNHQLFQRNDLAAAEFQQLIDRFPGSAFVDDARYNLALMSLNSNPQSSVSEAKLAVASKASPELVPNALFLEANAYQAMGAAAACGSAKPLYQQLSSAVSTDRPLAALRLSQLRCP